MYVRKLILNDIAKDLKTLEGSTSKDLLEKILWHVGAVENSNAIALKHSDIEQERAVEDALNDRKNDQWDEEVEVVIDFYFSNEGER